MAQKKSPWLPPRRPPPDTAPKIDREQVLLNDLPTLLKLARNLRHQSVRDVLIPHLEKPGNLYEVPSTALLELCILLARQLPTRSLLQPHLARLVPAFVEQGYDTTKLDEYLDWGPSSPDITELLDLAYQTSGVLSSSLEGIVVTPQLSEKLGYPDSQIARIYHNYRRRPPPLQWCQKISEEDILDIYCNLYDYIQCQLSRVWRDIDKLQGTSVPLRLPITVRQYQRVSFALSASNEVQNGDSILLVGSGEKLEAKIVESSDKMLEAIIVDKCFDATVSSAIISLDQTLFREREVWCHADPGISFPGLDFLLGATAALPPDSHGLVIWTRAEPELGEADGRVLLVQSGDPGSTLSSGGLGRHKWFRGDIESSMSQLKSLKNKAVQFKKGDEFWGTTAGRARIALEESGDSSSAAMVEKLEALDILSTEAERLKYMYEVGASHVLSYSGLVAQNFNTIIFEVKDYIRDFDLFSAIAGCHDLQRLYLLIRNQ